MRIAIHTLGCKVNQYETQSIEQELLRRGHELVDFEDTADAYIVNTCSVTAISDKKSRQMLRRAMARNPAAVVAACGCYAQTHADDVEALGVDVLTGTNDRASFLDLVERAAAEKTRIVRLDDALRRRKFEILPAGGMAARTRAMLKVEDGCVNFCTYCIIPFARGPVRSLPMDEAERQTRGLAAEGYREIVLTGIEISSYGRELPGDVSLIELVELVCRAAPDVRVRLGSLEPRTITRDFCERAAKLANLCPHFHLSLQSGCDATLRRMNRRYDTARYLESCALLREYFDDPAITTDLITGFPEETEAEFAKTLAFIERCAFADMHIFPYSIRPGMKAAEMAQVEKSVKEERAERAAAVARGMKAAYLARCVGRTLSVLFEGEENAGHAMNYAEGCAPGAAQNEVRAVRILRSDGERLYGEIER